VTAQLSDLLVPRDRTTIEAILLSTLQAESFPVTDWYAGGVARTILKMIATGLLDRETLIGYIAAGGYLDLAATLTDPNGTPIEDWLELLAQQQYDIERAVATFAQKRITLTCTTGPGPYTRAAGQLIAVSQAGNYYRNTDEVTIPDGGSVVATFQAETPGAGVTDLTGTIDELSSPLPGVSIVDTQAKFSTPVEFINGTGSIAASCAGTPSPARTIKVAITQTGRADDNSAYFTVTVYSDGTITTSAPAAMGATATTGDTTLTFTDGAGATNSFITGDVWYVSTPGEPTIQNGTDQESPAVLAQRCRDRWPALSAIPTEGKYASWIRTASVENSLGVSRVATAPSETIAGVLDIYVADQTGTATPETITTLQEYIDLRTVDIEQAVVMAAAGLGVTVTGTVTVRRGGMATVMAAAKTAWDAYLATVPIGGESPNGVVRIGKLWQVLMDSGAYDAVGLEINSAATDLELDPDQVPTALSDGTDNLTWVEVA
jgi:hypothetical protein